MCGIAGVLSTNAPVGELAEFAGAMGAALAARGPDDAGVWSDDSGQIALAHRRLAVIDLSPAGHQPMHASGGRYVIVFNGEIYNFRELRQQLCAAGVQFHGSSDTEVLLEAIALWGFEATLHRCNGCFALAVWDKTERRLYLARDRIGEKPLFYGWVNGRFLFASELKAMHASPGFVSDIDREAVARYLHFGYVPEPLSIYRNIRKLPPATFITMTVNAFGTMPVPCAYWSLPRGLASGDTPVTGTLQDATCELGERLQRAVSKRMIADVPIGAFLSGGVDSSLVVALMSKTASQPVSTFSIGFHEGEYNEAPEAALIARALGTDHTAFYVTATEARAIIPRLPTIYDEPLADTSQIPTAILSQLARKNVTVVMTGDGGDELFGGYRRYRSLGNFWARFGASPGWQRRMVTWIATTVTAMVSGTIVQQAARRLPAHANVLDRYERIRKFSKFSAFDDPMQMYMYLLALWPEVDFLLQGEPQVPCSSGGVHEIQPRSAFLDEMMHFDAASYLPGDILPKLDRASMACGLEARVPFLDHELIEFAARLPLDWKIRDGHGKIILRNLLATQLPQINFSRPKMGFELPIGAWLRGPLRDWAENLLDPVKLRDGGILQPAPILAAWREHCSGQRDLRYPLWAILMFQAWYEQWGHGAGRGSSL